MQPAHALPRRDARRAAALAAALVVATVAALAAAPRAHAATNAYAQRNLVSDIPGMARITDPNLVNPWGLAIGPTTPVWVANNGTSTATLYPGAAGMTPIQPSPFVVQVPHGLPTGQVFNDSDAFVVHSMGASGASVFLFASQTGWITGWSPAVPPPAPSTHAQNGRHVPGAVFTGLAIAMHRGAPQLYASDFAGRRIVVLDGHFRVRHLMPNAFMDRGLPAGYSPFNIEALGGRLYVAYAKVDPMTGEEQAGNRLGFVDVYSTGGRLLHRLIQRTGLNAPWGFAMAPAGFGPFGGDLLVGNFGNGRIHAYDPMTGAFKGVLRRPNGMPVEIEGLWGLEFGNGVTGDRKELLFAAGIDDETHGLFGLLRPRM
jgi:uncharacterized protein (TIGR03118 family)